MSHKRKRGENEVYVKKRIEGMEEEDWRKTGLILRQ